MSIEKARSDLANGGGFGAGDVMTKIPQQKTTGTIVRHTFVVPAVHQIGLVVYDECHETKSTSTLTFGTLNRRRFFRDRRHCPRFIFMSGNPFSRSKKSMRLPLCCRPTPPIAHGL
jgi:hypothetical protein